MMIGSYLLWRNDEFYLDFLVWLQLEFIREDLNAIPSIFYQSYLGYVDASTFILEGDCTFSLPAYL